MHLLAFVRGSRVQPHPVCSKIARRGPWGTVAFARVWDPCSACPHPCPPHSCPPHSSIKTSLVPTSPVPTRRAVGRGPIRIVSSQDSKISQWFGWLLAHQLDKTLESSVAPSTLFAPYYSYYFYYFYYFDSFHSTLLSKIPRQNKEKEKSSLQGQ